MDQHGGSVHIPAVQFLPYSRLHRGKSEGNNEIRLLYLSPGQSDSMLTAQISNVTFKDAPAYTALSYVWGQQKEGRRPLLVIYESKVYSLSVGENLGTALRHTRNKREVLTLWIDALCIDQREEPASVQEKSWQVEMMAAIYKHSSKTIVWLGPGSDSTDSAMKGMARASEMLGPLLRTPTQGWIENLEMVLGLEWLRIATDSDEQSSLLQQQLIRSPFSERMNEDTYRSLFTLITGCQLGHDVVSSVPHVLNGIKDMSLRTWWSRVWILQEYRLSPSIRFRCGDSEVDDVAFCRGFQLCRAVFGFVNGAESHFPATLQGLNPGNEISLSEIAKDVLSMRHRTFDPASHGTFGRIQFVNYPGRKDDSRGASNARDRIFAALGILDDRLGTVPNYEMSTNEVYCQFTERLLQSKALHILTRVRPTKNKLKVPTWCIDWTAAHPNTSYRLSSQRIVQPFPDMPIEFLDGPTRFYTNFNQLIQPKKMLKTQARILGRIVHKSLSFAATSRLLHAHHNCYGHYHADACIWLMEVYITFILHAKPGQDVFYDMVRLFLPDAFTKHLEGGDANAVEPPQAGNDCGSVIESCAWLSNRPVESFLPSLEEMASSQRLATTDTRQFGYAIEDAECGDVVAQIGPYEYQVVLREIEAGVYKIVGGAHFPQSVDRIRKEVDVDEKLTRLWII